MAEGKKSSTKKDTKSAIKSTATKPKSTKPAARKTSAAKSGSKTSVKQRSATKSEVKPISETKISNESKQKSFLVDAAENIDAGAKLVKDRTAEIAADLAGKASSFKDTLLHKVKKGVSEAYEAGSKAVEELTETAQDYAEKYKHKMEINKLKAKQDRQYTVLGSLIFEKYKVAGLTPAKLLKEKDIVSLINEIENTVEQIVEQGKALDKLDKK